MARLLVLGASGPCRDGCEVDGDLEVAAGGVTDRAPPTDAEEDEEDLMSNGMQAHCNIADGSRDFRINLVELGCRGQVLWFRKSRT